MKVAEALAQVKDIKGKVSEVQRKIVTERLFKKVVESQEVPSIEMLLEEFVRLNDSLRKLKSRLDETNVKYGLHDKIHQMESLRYVISGLEVLSQSQQETINLERIDYDGPAQPFTTYATYDVSALDLQLETFKLSLRKLDMELQQLNWTIDVV